MLYLRLESKYLRFVFLVVAIFTLLSSLGISTASSYYNLIMQSQTTISPPDVVLQEGSVGSSTIYANSTSAKVSVTAPIYDFVDINTGDVDSIADKGTHSNFSAQQAGPDSLYDTLTEEGETEVIEDYVDSISDVDSSPDIGTHSSFNNMKAYDSTYDTLNETIEEISKVGSDTQGTGTSSPLQWSHTLVSGTNRLVVIAIGWENNGACTVTGVTYGGQTCTEVIQSNTGGVGYLNGAAIYYIDEDTLPSDGVNQVSVTFSAASTADFSGYCMEFTGVDLSGPDDWDETSEAAPADATIENTGLSAVATDLCVSVVEAGNTGSFAHGQSQNERIDFTDASSQFAVTDLISTGSISQLDSTFSGTLNRLSRMAAHWSPAAVEYDLDLEVQFTNIIDFLATENLCIYMGTMGTEALNVSYWTGSGWSLLDSDLTASSWNNYTVSLSGVNFSIRFETATLTGDSSADEYQIDAVLLQVSGVGSKEDPVDQQSDIDSSPDVGTHGNFLALQYGPDSINDTLTEVNSGGASNTTLINAESFEGAWPPSGWTQTAFSNWAQESNFVYDGTYSADFDGAFGDPSGYLTTPTMDCSDASAIYVDFWWYDNGLDIDDFELEYYDGSVWDNYQDLDALESGNGWHHYTENITDSQYFVSNFQIRWWANSVSNFETGCVDLVTVKKEIQSADNYELDLEVQWVDLPYLLPNETLCIYGGTMGAEDIKVDVWNGTGWENVFNDLSTGWNNVSITDWLTNSNFTIRFRGGTETGDTNQDTWQIDIALINVWTEANYELDLEVQWANAEYTRTNEELCIKTGTFTGSENIQVRIWNSTGSSWNWIMNLTANQWNNVSITSYLTSSTFTVQFLGGTETDDTTLDSWNIDATLLHVWTSDDNYDYVDNNTWDVDSSADKGTHGNFSAQQYGPDSIYDTVTEDNTGVVSNVTIIEDWESGSIASENWTTYSSAAQGRIVVDTDTPYEGSYALWMDVDTGGTYSLNELITNFDFSGATQVILDFYHNEQGDENEAGSDHTDHQNADGVYYTLDGSYWYHLVDLVDPSGWTNVNINVTADPDFQGPVNSSFAIKFTQYDNWPRINDGRGFENINITYQTIVENYELDLEVQWTETPYFLQNEELCIRTGATGTEDVKVDVWNGTEWINVLTDLTPNSWNNISVSSYLTSFNFTIRFKGGNEVSDTTQDSWDIDATLLCLWTNGESYDYVLKVNNTVTDSWQIRLKKYSDSNISRLQNCTIYFHNSTDGNSNQIEIQNGAYINETGSWYDLDNSENIYIAMTVQANTTGTSHISIYLEVRKPGTSIYAQYIITFEIT